MTKLRVALIVLLALFSISAFAEGGDDYRTLNSDLYYHEASICGNTENRVPISGEAAETFSKYPCPICVQEESKTNEVQAVTRGGTIVLCFPDEYLYAQELTGVFGFSATENTYGQEAWEALGEQLHGDRLMSFLNDYLSNGSAEGVSCAPCVLCMNEELMMNCRHLGSAWYITIRPTQLSGKSWEMYWRVDAYDIRFSADQEVQLADGATVKTDVFSACFNQQTVEDYMTVALQSMNDDSAVFSKRFDDVELHVFEGLGGYIGLLYESGADADMLEDVEIRIGNSATFNATGYLNGDKAVYVFVLTEAEVNAVQNEGETVSVYRMPLTETADFMGGTYASAKKGSAGSGIIDQSGSFVIEPIYARIERPSAESYRIDAPRPFFLYRENGDVTVLDGESLQVIAEIKKQGAYLSAEYMNPAAFKVRTQQGMAIYSLRSGERLYEVPFGADGNYPDNISDIDGYFRVFADGDPTCLVMNKGYLLDSESYLIDTSDFRRASESFNSVTPLIWKDGKGVFLVENHNCAELKNSFFGEYASGFEYGERYDGSAYGESWHCGLIDDQGAIIAPVVYNSVEVLSENEIRLGMSDGTMKTVTPFA